MKFKVGDTVRVRENLEVGKTYKGQIFNDSMYKYKGKKFTIATVNSSEYVLKEIPWYWTDEMLEPVQEKTCENCSHRGDNDFNKEIYCYKCMDYNKWELAEEKEDLIHNPKHYTYSKHEPIDVIKAWNLDFDLGNVVKYIARCEHKGNKLQDLNKALEYLQHEIKHLEGKQ